MGLKRFDYKLPGQRKNFKQIAIVLCICLIAVLSFTSYALYEVRNPNDLVNSKVGEFNTSDVSLAILVDGVKQKEFPSKGTGKVFDSLSCTNGGNASWSSFYWKLSIKDISGPTECTINFKTGTEPETPELNNGLIPVVYQDNKWVKADTTKEWYNYYDQWWANAVTVTSSSRSAHASSEAGTEIPMNDIETMWVWVPRYEYNFKLLETTANYGGTSENPGTKAQPKGIEINFISKDTVSASSSNFTIHDAFKWGDNKESQLSGIWVAKFEMSAPNVTGNTLQAPIIKPNAVSWRNAQIGTFWTAIHQYMNGTNNQYGITNSDVHLMKNMEWGAVAYLSQSKYGKYGNQNYTGANKEVAINNCSTYKTGIGGDTVSASSSSTTCTTNTYETEKGQAASTTGNIYGIYDMSGGAFEYVMGVMKESSNTEVAVGSSTSSNSGWSGKVCDYNGNCSDYTGTYDRLGDDPSTTDVIEGIGERYYDLYEYGTSDSDYTRGHIGDATKEVIASDSASTYAGWYSDYADFVYSNYPFFERGGYYSFGTAAGVFGFNGSGGYAYSYRGGRAVAVHAS